MAIKAVASATTQRTVAGVVSTIQFSGLAGPLLIRNLDPVAALYYRVDGVDPVVEGDDSYIVPPLTAQVVPISDRGGAEIRVISDSPAETKYSVEAI